MKSSVLFEIGIAAFALLWALPALADTPAPPVNAALNPLTSPADTISYEGTITQMNPDGFVLVTRYSDKTITVRTADYTAYNAVDSLRPRDLTVGEKAFVAGNLEKKDNSISVNLLYVNPNNLPDPDQPSDAEKKTGITGTIAAANPGLLTGDDGQTYSLKYNGIMAMWMPATATASDLSAGKLVRVTGQTNGDFSNEIITATKVTMLNPPVNSPPARPNNRPRPSSSPNPAH